MNYKIQHRAFIIILLSVYAFSFAQNPTNAYGSADTIVKRFTYSAPHYYAAERTQMGYGVVETHEMHTATHPHSVYRKQKRHYNNTDFLEHGKLIYEAVTDSLDRRYVEYRLDSITYIDPDGMTTTHTYDGYGRRTQRTHPDAGTSRWSYDHAGNLIASQTQSQINRNQATHYHYTYNQLDSICYEQYPQTNVYYQYDAAGRVSQRRDLTETENFEYDKFGNVARSTRLIVMPNERAGYRFTTRWNYINGKFYRK